MQQKDQVFLYENIHTYSVRNNYHFASPNYFLKQFSLISIYVIVIIDFSDSFTPYVETIIDQIHFFLYKICIEENILDTLRNVSNYYLQRLKTAYWLEVIEKKTRESSEGGDHSHNHDHNHNEKIEQHNQTSRS